MCLVCSVLISRLLTVLFNSRCMDVTVNHCPSIPSHNFSLAAIEKGDGSGDGEG